MITGTEYDIYIYIFLFLYDFSSLNILASNLLCRIRFIEFNLIADPWPYNEQTTYLNFRSSNTISENPNHLLMSTSIIIIFILICIGMSKENYIMMWLQSSSRFTLISGLLLHQSNGGPLLQIIYCTTTISDTMIVFDLMGCLSLSKRIHLCIFRLLNSHI